MKKAKLEKSPWVKVKKKPGPKKVEKSFDEAKKLQLAESDKGSSQYNQSDFLSNPSSSKDIGASRIKITVSAAEKFEDEKSDSGESNTVGVRNRYDAGDNPAIFAFDRLKANLSAQPRVLIAGLVSNPLGLPVSCSASIQRRDECLPMIQCV